ncbi:hypothetical protein Micbo1qcDRAFT_208155 [Microdochium bolleyi]|uniref:Zn(2)-C6 fungal-type domain-containing protein n=1 Tax=Microdochium bolleyi TaxID=196109 RepID=A0A136IRJ3_9PEZI|nr:hypothetical protein Micbo1qcDRAFT_208155 [Microdochium bolleyi]
MVYLGPSKGCLTCRQRRKKCDEARPSCNRCVKAGRTCRGYEDKNVNTFRSYIQSPTTSTTTSTTTTTPVERQKKGTSSTSPLPQLIQTHLLQQPFVSEARRCSLPVRAPAPGTTSIPEDFRQAEVTESERLQYALRGFFYDCCVLTTSTRLSRGFLSGVELLTRQLGLDSHLVRGCEAVAYAVHGKTLDRPNLTLRAETRYQDLLGQLAQLIEFPDARDEREPWLVALLLGVYQIIHASEDNPSNHAAHSRGLAALLGIPSSPLALLQPLTYQTRSRLTRPAPFFVAPSTNPSTTSETLDSLILSTYALWTRYQPSSPPSPSLSSPTARGQHLDSIRTDAIALDSRFQHWQDTRAPEFRPVTSGHIPEHVRDNSSSRCSGTASRTPPVGYWPGPVDSYFDHYVAGVWNIFRAARLLVLHLIITSSRTPDSNSSSTSPTAHGSNHRGAHVSQQYIATAQRTVAGILSSIPYSLTDSLPDLIALAEAHHRATRTTARVTFTGITSLTPDPAAAPDDDDDDNKDNDEWPEMDTGRVSGGLLLLHPLHVAISMMPSLVITAGEEDDEEDATRRRYMRQTLAWIGTKGGVGLAGLYAKAEGVLDIDELSSSCLLIWAGFLA